MPPLLLVPELLLLQVYAYLEAHMYKQNRVQIVVEEFLGMVESRREETPSPQVRLFLAHPSIWLYLYLFRLDLGRTVQSLPWRRRVKGKGRERR